MSSLIQLENKNIERLFRSNDTPPQIDDYKSINFNLMISRGKQEEIMEVIDIKTSLLSETTVEKFLACVNQDYRTDQYNDKRSLDPIRIDKYLKSLSGISKEFASYFLSQTRYIGFTEMYNSLLKSVSLFKEVIGDRPWSLLLTLDKYGSEHWLTQLLFQDKIFDKNISIVNNLIDKSDIKDIVIIDDCSYTGSQIFSIMDQEIYNTKKSVKTDRVFHIVCPFVSTYAREAIDSIKYASKKFKVSAVFYTCDGKFLSGLQPSIEKLSAEKDEKGNVLPMDNKFFYIDNDDVLLKNEIAKTLGLNSVSSFVPIYFDHKISDSTATPILEAVVYPLPSRDLILKAERCYRSIDTSNIAKRTSRISWFDESESETISKAENKKLTITTEKFLTSLHLRLDDNLNLIDHDFRTDQYNDKRSLDPIRINKYLKSLTGISKEFATLFLSKVRYVGFTEMYSCLLKSINKFKEAIGDRPWTLLLTTDKYGSEHWLTQLLFQDKIFDENTRVTNCLEGKNDTKDVMILDDCSYSGMNVFSVIDEETYRINQTKKGSEIDYTFHVVCPFISVEARDAVLSLKEVNSIILVPKEPLNITILFYPYDGNFIPRLQSEEKNKKFFYTTECTEIALNKEICNKLILDSLSALIPIYFDHKIASNISTAKSILESVVYPLPTRDLILKAEVAYSSQE